MSDRKWMFGVGVILLSIISLSLFIAFALDAQKIHDVVLQLRGKEVPRKQAYHLMLIEQAQEHPYWKMVEKGALDAAKIYGMKIEYHGPARNSMEEQITLLEKAVAAKVDGIIVQGLNDKKFSPVINGAVEKGIPVLTIDTDAPTSKRLTYVGTDNFEAGKRLGHKVVQAARGRGNIGVIIGSDSAENQILRLEGLKSIIKNYPEMKMVSVGISNISRIGAIQESEEMLRKYPEINIMVGTSALDAIGILQAKKNLNRQAVKIFGFDNLPETLKAVDGGDIESTLVQNPYGMGFESVRLLHDYFQGRELPKEHFTRIFIIDKSNVELEVKELEY